MESDKFKTKVEITHPTKTWSQKHDQCLNCGTKERPHRARGLCSLCYTRETENRQQSHIKRKTRSLEGKINLSDLRTSYHKLKMSLNDIARKYNCTRQYIHKLMKRYRISRRDKFSAREIALVKGKIIRNSKDEFGINKLVTFQKNIINKDFFKSWSPEMAYVLGVIYTDGNLSPEAHYNNLKTPPKITISQKEPEILEKVLALTGSKAKILFRKQRGTAGSLHYFHISDEDIYEDLLKLGLKPKKSLTLLFPDMEAQYIRHFIRGCWDGDGSVYRERKYPNMPCASFVSGSKAFIEELIQHLVKLGLPNRTIHAYKGGKAFYFRYTGIDCAKLYHILYDEVPETMYLRRKYERFKAIADSFEFKHKSGFKFT